MLREFAKNWMPLLFNAFVAAPPGRRSHLRRAISAYATLTDPAMLETFFKTVVRKLIKVRSPPPLQAPNPRPDPLPPWRRPCLLRIIARD